MLAFICLNACVYGIKLLSLHCKKKTKNNLKIKNMKTINLNYDSVREEFDAAAELAMKAGQVTIISPDKNVDKTQYTITAKMVDGRWQIEDNDPLHANGTVREANKKASQPDEYYNAQNVIRTVILDTVEYATSEDDITVNVEENNEENEEVVENNEEDAQIVEYKSEKDGRTYEVSIREDDDNFYINFNTGLGEGIYPKADWALERAIEDQANI